MSCFMCSDETLLALALDAAKMRGERLDRELVQAHVLTLYAANLASVNERYSKNPTESNPPQVTWNLPNLTPVERLKAADCFEYQASDWSGYEGSEAQKLVRLARKHAVVCLPGYDEAPWR